MAMLLTLVGMSLSALLVPTVANQVTATRTSSERIQELDAAQAGLDVALGRLRAASDGAGNGVLETLPLCDLTGSLSPDASLRPARYRVTITYRNADGTAMNCPPLDVPATASLTATGIMTPDVAFSAGSPGTRTIDATYTFSTTNANITGGAIRLAASTNGALCMDAGLDASPAAGTRLQIQPCVSGASDQRFAYTQDLNLKLVGSQSSTVPKGMCLDAGSPHANGAYVTFQPCQNRIAPQQWSLNNSSNFQGTGDGVNLDGYCFNLQNPGLSGSAVMLGGCGSGDNQRRSPAVRSVEEPNRSLRRLATKPGRRSTSRRRFLRRRCNGALQPVQ